MKRLLFLGTSDILLSDRREVPAFVPSVSENWVNRKPGVSGNTSSETVRKGYEQQSERGFGRYTERKMDRKATPWRPLRLRWERPRDFSDSLSRQLGE
jgi:hypothetical protein